MTRRDEVIRMAVEAGFRKQTAEGVEIIERFAALVAAAERERCLFCYSPDDTATDWSDKIRALKDEVSE